MHISRAVMSFWMFIVIIIWVLQPIKIISLILSPANQLRWVKGDGKPHRYRPVHRLLKKGVRISGILHRGNVNFKKITFFRVNAVLVLKKHDFEIIWVRTHPPPPPSALHTGLWIEVRTASTHSATGAAGFWMWSMAWQYCDMYIGMNVLVLFPFTYLLILILKNIFYSFFISLM